MTKLVDMEETERRKDAVTDRPTDQQIIKPVKRNILQCHQREAVMASDDICWMTSVL